MNKLMTGALALSLAASLSACSSDAGQTASPSAAPSVASTTTTTTTTTTTSAPTGAIDQSTPEAVMTAWVNVLVDAKSADICTLTAIDGKIASDVGNNEECTKSFGSLAGSLKSASSLLDGLTITGATVNGDKATFEKATTKPDLVAQLIKSLAAVKIGSKWYVTTP